ncbi:Pyoverdine/dityrosine biosynthesis protein-domain-containing protein [Phaeosphaeria sp. MPI-PUGE-AT-0046c]|nr:Pyoverdine/dityrosine biosynthesis protein-domain-containing protein [Phaeosphaeria sp. MPI-PUGE-AT-0046c]
MNVGSSPYHSIGGLFCRGQNGDLLSSEGRSAVLIATHWSKLRSLLTADGQSSIRLPSGIEVTSTSFDTTLAQDIDICSNPESHTHYIREVTRTTEYSVGLVSCRLNEAKDDLFCFNTWLEHFVLLETTLGPAPSSSALEDPKVSQVTEKVTNIFETTLKNTASQDEWHTGVDLFRKRVAGFVARRERIQMALPAFPCKSPNAKKVGASGPDMAEQIALNTLHGFAQKVKTMYDPGVTIWIVSDGHVFSDCIGVADEAVSNYDLDLLITYQRTFATAEDRDALRFRGLTDMFFSDISVRATFDEDWKRNFDIEHPVDSVRSPDAELARCIMMAGFQSSRTQFRKLIAEQHPQTLNLYRGQARFMQDDLSDAVFSTMSKKQKKKLSFAVAAEMIARNQAYSNLLELLLPNYVRLSIHAHSNRGPKFGICLFPRDRVHAIDSIVDRHALCPSYEFQVPTPWHNSIIKIAGDDMVYLGKAEMVHKVIEEGAYEGGWVDDIVEGGHFAIHSTVAAFKTPYAVNDSASTVYIDYSDVKHLAVANDRPIDIELLEASHDGQKMRLSLRLRERLYRAFELPRLLARRVIGDKSSLGSAERGVAVSAR